MKTFALAATVVAGLLCSAGTADAQFRNRNRGAVYSYPTYSYPTYSYPATSTPLFTIPGTNTGIVVTSGYTPTTGGAIYSNGSYYSQPYYSQPYYSNGYYNNGYYNNGYYNNGYYDSNYYNGVQITPSGVRVGNRRIWRW